MWQQANATARKEDGLLRDISDAYKGGYGGGRGRGREKVADVERGGLAAGERVDVM